MVGEKLPPRILEFFKKTGSQGGKKRAATHSKKQLSEWGKLGGRPKKNIGKKNNREDKEKK